MSLVEFFCSWGLEEHAQALIRATDATNVDDLLVLDEDLVQNVIADVDLRCVSAKKFEAAVSSLRPPAIPACPKTKQPKPQCTQNQVTHV